jgi:hypothetical protein
MVRVPLRVAAVAAVLLSGGTATAAADDLAGQADVVTTAGAATIARPAADAAPARALADETQAAAPDGGATVAPPSADGTPSADQATSTEPGMGAPENAAPENAAPENAAPENAAPEAGTAGEVQQDATDGQPGGGSPATQPADAGPVAAPTGAHSGASGATAATGSAPTAAPSTREAATSERGRSVQRKPRGRRNHDAPKAPTPETTSPRTPPAAPADPTLPTDPAPSDPDAGASPDGRSAADPAGSPAGGESDPTTVRPQLDVEPPAASTTAGPAAHAGAAGQAVVAVAPPAGPDAAPVAHPAPYARAPVAPALPSRAADAVPTPLLVLAQPGPHAVPAVTRPARSGADVPNAIAGWSAPTMAGGQLLPHADAFAPPDTTPRKTEDHESTPAAPKHGGGRPSPEGPSRPPGGVGAAGSGAGSGGGASTALFCAILVGLLAYPVQELRRHRFRLVVAGPVGVVFPQQRPG